MQASVNRNMNDMLTRVWENLIGRLDGPIHFRLIIQPAIAAILATLAGLKDARGGRPAFFWAVVTTPGRRRELVQEGWKDVGKVFIVAIVLDSIYQLIVHRGVYGLELLITATVLAIVPYILVRGPVNRLARLFSSGKQSAPPGKEAAATASQPALQAGKPLLRPNENNPEQKPGN